MKTPEFVTRPIIGVGALLLILLIGTLGYSLIEGWSFIDSLFMTVITVSTVGYQEVHSLSDGGRIFSIFLILGGVGAIFYILSSIVENIVEGQLGIRLGRQRMEAKIHKLNDHFVLCGYGRVGRAVAGVLRQGEANFIVIDDDEDAIDKANHAGYLTVHGNATNDDVLRHARINSAKGIILALPNDADNTYIALTARELNPAIPIIARGSTEDAEKKLRLAGATRIVAPETIGGQRMARLALRPTVLELVDSFLFTPQQELLVEEMEVGDNEELSKSTIHQLEEQFDGIRVLALKKKDSTLVPNPTPRSTVDDSASIIVFGPLQQIRDMEQWCESCRLHS